MRRGFALLAILFMVAAGGALAVSPGPEMAKQATFGDRGNDIPTPAFTNGRSDTIWYGGLGDDGLAKEGGLWDFDTDLHGDPFQGWTSRDLTADVGVRYGRVTSDDFTGDPYAPMLPPVPPATENVGQLWVGIHQDEANLRDFVCGMGYSNNQCQRGFSPECTYAGDSVAIQFDYFCHSEPDFDYTYIYLLCYDEYDDLIEEHLVDYLDGVSPGGDSLGTYNWEHPQTFSGGVSAGELHADTETLQLELRFYSDGGWSDEDGYWATPAGPFAADNITIDIGGSIVGDYNFETSAEGWTFDICEGIGAYMGVVPEATFNAWIASSGHPGGCDLQGNALEFVDEESSPYYPPGHPVNQHELAMSNVIARDAGYYPPAYNTTIVRYNAFYYLTYSAGTFYRPGYMYYPHTSEVNPIPHWSARRGQNVWYLSGEDPICGLFGTNLSTLDGNAGDPAPQDWDSLRICYELHCSCERFMVAPDICNTDPYAGQTWGSPIVDNVKLGLTSEADAPPIVFEFVGAHFHDGFGQNFPTYLEPCDLGNANVARDLSSWNNDENDWHADTTGVAGPLVSPGNPDSRWWVELRAKVVQKGARQDWIQGYHAWKDRFDGDPETEFVAALMDSFEICVAGHWMGWPNKYSSHFHELDPNANGFLEGYPDLSQEQEILPDEIWSPGTKIEYYFASFWYDNYPNPAPEQIFIYGPWEFEILPGMELNLATPGEYDVIWPCVLYIDAFNRGAEYYIEPLLDQAGIVYDKFDYLDAGGCWTCSMARDFGGTVFNPGGYGNNGCTLEQFLGYRLILLNTGSFGLGCMAEDDWVMFKAWLDDTSLGTDFRKGFIFDGDNICEILAEYSIANTLGVTFEGYYREISGNTNYCVELVAPESPDPAFPVGPVWLYGNDAASFNVIGTQAGVPGVVGNLCYDNAQMPPSYVCFAQVVRENIQPGIANWKTIVNGFSLSALTASCPPDSASIAAGMAAVFGPAIEWILDGTAPFDPWYKNPEDNAVEEGETHLAGAVNHLYMSRPNPFAARATIRFNLAETGQVSLVIYDVSGRLIKTLANGVMDAGENTLVWNATDNSGNRVGGGIFWMQMSTHDGYVSGKKMLVLR